MKRFACLLWLAPAAGCAFEPGAIECQVGGAARGLFNASADAGELELEPEHAGAVAALSLVLDDGSAAPPCSAVIIDATWALSAAHCAAGRRVSGGELRVGQSSEAPLARFAIARAIAHPDLDAMLLELSDPGAVASMGIAAIALDARPPVPESRAVLAGYGLTEQATSGERRFVAEAIADVDETMVVVDGEGRSGACFGDSGGPLLGLDGRGAPRVQGVLSRGSSDCLGLDYYVRADRIRSWACAQGIDCAPVGSSIGCTPGGR